MGEILRSGVDIQDFRTENTDIKESESLYSKRFELRDTNGNLLGLAEISTGDLSGDESEQIPSYLKDAGLRRLLSFVLEKDGKSVDVLQLVNLKDGQSILVASNFKDIKGQIFGWSYDPREKVVFLPEPSNLITIAVMLHELGHAKQFENSFFSEIIDDEKYPVSLLLDEDPEAVFAPYLEIFPELASRVPDQETLKKIKGLQREIDEINDRSPIREDILQARESVIRAEIDRIYTEKYNEERKNPTDKSVLDKLQEQIARHYEELKSINIQIEANKSFTTQFEQQLRQKTDELSGVLEPYRELLRSSKKYIERDATRRAFKFMRVIEKKIGLDMFTNQKAVEGVELDHSGDEYNVRDFLLEALESYCALDKIAVPSRKKIKLKD